MNHKNLSIPLPARRERIRSAATSWVERFEYTGKRYYLKTYVYRGARAWLRGAFRNTFLAPSRARREWRALRHLAAAGIQPDLAVDLVEKRRFGCLLEARLLTREFAGQDLETRLLENRPLSATEREELERFVRRLHESGLRDPDLKARNILLRGEGAEVAFAKIDSSSSWLVRPGDRLDAARKRDLAILAADLARLAGS